MVIYSCLPDPEYNFQGITFKVEIPRVMLWCLGAPSTGGGYHDLSKRRFERVKFFGEFQKMY